MKCDFCNLLVKIFMEYDSWNLLVNILIAIGTCGATYFALYPRKEKEILEKLAKAYRELDIAAKKNVIHKNKASRLKSRLAKSVKK